LKGWYVIFDEIQYLRDWDVHLKSLVESYREVRFIVSGSAASALKLKSHESGAGRFTDFMLPPLTFYEFITMQGLQDHLQVVEHAYGGENVQLFKAADIRQFNRSLVDSVNFGGSPEALFSASVRENPERFIRNDVIDQVLLRDLPALYGISKVQELNSLFTTIAYNTANEFSIERLSIQAACPKKTIKKYLEYLEAAFLIKTVRRTDQAGRRFQRDNFFKIYLTNPSLRAALFSPVQAEEEAMGPLTETGSLRAMDAPHQLYSMVCPMDTRRGGHGGDQQNKSPAPLGRRDQMVGQVRQKARGTEKSPEILQGKWLKRGGGDHQDGAPGHGV
jgi:predicted AAA+ superfamily ATPase